MDMVILAALFGAEITILRLFLKEPVDTDMSIVLIAGGSLSHQVQGRRST